MFRCANCKQRLQLHVTRISYQSSAIHSDSINNNWNNWLAGTLNLFHFQYDWILTGQHDRQDERLTGQIHSQSGHCPLTGPYFEPCLERYNANKPRPSTILADFCSGQWRRNPFCGQELKLKCVVRCTGNGKYVHYCAWRNVSSCKTCCFAVKFLHYLLPSSENTEVLKRVILLLLTTIDYYFDSCVRYGLRCVAMSLRVALSEKFPEAPESEILMVNGETLVHVFLFRQINLM